MSNNESGRIFFSEFLIFFCFMLGHFTSMCIWANVSIQPELRYVHLGDVDMGQGKEASGFLLQRSKRHKGKAIGKATIHTN